MRTPILTLGLLALLVHAKKPCERYAVRVKYSASAKSDIQGAYNDMSKLVVNSVNTYCISHDPPAVDPIAKCWYNGCTSDDVVMVCGFVIWRFRASCDVTSQLNNLFKDHNLLWTVFDAQPLQDVKCS